MTANRLCPAGDEAFRSTFAALAARDTGAAFAAAFAQGGDSPTVLVSGPRHKTCDDPVGLQAPWHIGSITKSFTAALTLRLAERGFFTLDAPAGSLLERHAEGMHPDWRAITLRQALSHTAGLPANVSLLQLLRPGTKDPVAERLSQLRRLWRKPLRGKAGRFAYSNVGYVLAGAIAEAAAGSSWEALIVSELAKPLNLSSLGFGAPKQAEAAWGHQSFLGFQTPKDPEKEGSDNPAWMGPAGGLHLNLADLARWGQTQLAAANGTRRDVLTRESAQAMQTAVTDDYGLGWVVQPLPDHNATLIWANGSNTFWYALLAMVPERDLVIAVALNRFHQKRGDAALQDLLRAILLPLDV